MTKAWVSHCVGEAIRGRASTVISELGCPFDATRASPTTARGGRSRTRAVSGGDFAVRDGDRSSPTPSDSSWPRWATARTCSPTRSAATTSPKPTTSRFSPSCSNNGGYGAVRHSVLDLYPTGYAAKAEEMPLTGLTPTPGLRERRPGMPRPRRDRYRRRRSARRAGASDRRRHRGAPSSTARRARLLTINDRKASHDHVRAHHRRGERLRSRRGRRTGPSRSSRDRDDRLAGRSRRAEVRAPGDHHGQARHHRCRRSAAGRAMARRRARQQRRARSGRPVAEHPPRPGPPRLRHERVRNARHVAGRHTADVRTTVGTDPDLVIDRRRRRRSDDRAVLDDQARAPSDGVRDAGGTRPGRDRRRPGEPRPVRHRFQRPHDRGARRLVRPRRVRGPRNWSSSSAPVRGSR